MRRLLTFHFVIATTIALPPSIAHAQTEVGATITGIARGNLIVYKDEKGEQVLSEVPKDQVAEKKLVILRSNGEFAEIKLNGKSGWVDLDKVSLARKTPPCPGLQNISSETSIAGSHGASGKTNCK